MKDIKTFEGSLVVRDAMVGIIVARFNSFIVDSLLQGAVDTFLRHGLSEESLHLIRVPGAFEMPLAAKRAAATGRYDALVALGAVIRGGTPHFEYVAGECTKGIAQVSMEFNLPVAFGVLTVDSIEQAIERAGTKAGNKGAEAALSALEMLDLLRRLD